jgi:hypothetical protein
MEVCFRYDSDTKQLRIKQQRRGVLLPIAVHLGDIIFYDSNNHIVVFNTDANIHVPQLLSV